MEQTAVEWLIEQIMSSNIETYHELYERFEKAKEMEREQIETAFLQGMTNSEDYFDPTIEGEQIPEERTYYNKTYKNKVWN